VTQAVEGLELSIVEEILPPGSTSDQNKLPITTGIHSSMKDQPISVTRIVLVGRSSTLHRLGKSVLVEVRLLHPQNFANPGENAILRKWLVRWPIRSNQDSSCVSFLPLADRIQRLRSLRCGENPLGSSTPISHMRLV